MNEDSPEACVIRVIIQDVHGEADQASIGDDGRYGDELEDTQPGADVLGRSGYWSLKQLHKEKYCKRGS